MPAKAPSNDPEKLELEKKKLRAEIRKTVAEAKSAELYTDAYRQEIAEEAASDDKALIYYFDKDVGNASVRACMSDLAVWSRRDPGADITIVFNSPGGGVFAGMALFDFIEQLKDNGHHVTTVALGWAASMAGILLQAGSTRVIGRNAWVMIHEVSAGAIGTTSEIEDEAKLLKRMQDRVLDIFVERGCTLTKRQIANRWTRKNWWLDSEETVALGFADEVR